MDKNNLEESKDIIIEIKEMIENVENLKSKINIFNEIIKEQVSSKMV